MVIYREMLQVFAWVYNSRSTQSSNLHPQALSVRSDSRIRLGLAHPALNGCRDLGHLPYHQNGPPDNQGPNVQKNKTHRSQLQANRPVIRDAWQVTLHGFTFLDCSTYETVTNLGNRNPFSCSNYSCYQNSWQTSATIPPPWSLLLAFGPHGSL